MVEEIYLMEKEKFFDEFLLNQEDLENLEEITGIETDRARQIWEIIKKVGMEDFSITKEKSYLKAIYNLGVDPDDEEERKEYPDIFLGLTGIERVYAGYLLAWEQAYSIFISLRKKT